MGPFRIENTSIPGFFMNAFYILLFVLSRCGGRSFLYGHGRLLGGPEIRSDRIRIYRYGIVNLLFDL